MRDQVDQQVIAARPDGGDRKALSKEQKRITIVDKNAGLQMCLLAQNIHQTGVIFLFPGLC